MGKIKVYVIARISREYHEKNERICKSLDSRFEVFIPHKNNPYNTPHSKFEAKVAQIDYFEMDKSDLGLISEPFWGDCSCEIGYFLGRGMPTLFFIENSGNWQNIWMAKYAIAAVAAANKSIMEIVKKDPILKNKTIGLTTNEKELSDFVYQIASKYQRQ